MRSGPATGKPVAEAATASRVPRVRSLRARSAEAAVHQAPMGSLRRRVRVLAIGGCVVLREGVVAMLRDAPGIEVVGSAGGAAEVPASSAMQALDVVLVNVLLSGGNGIDAARQAGARWAEAAIIVLSTESGEDRLIEALEAGAVGYLGSDCSRDLLRSTIHAVAEGGVVLEREALLGALRPLARERHGPSRSRAGRPGTSVPLTAREMDVLRLLADGCTNKEIGADLHLAVVTVKKYVQSLAGKLGAADRTQAAVQALRLGLVK